jgi:hypothetical protein
MIATEVAIVWPPSSLAAVRSAAHVRDSDPGAFKAADIWPDEHGATLAGLVLLASDC